MQKIHIYLQTGSVKAELIDAQGNRLNSVPAITRGMRVQLELHLLDADGEPVSGLNTYASWEFYLGHDWSPQTTVQLAVLSGITAANGVVSIPVTNTNTAEMLSQLGSAEEQQFHAELNGFSAGETNPALVLQFELKVRNRVSTSGTGTPAALPSVYLTAGEVQALIASSVSSMLPSLNALDHWVVNGVDTGVSAVGPQGPQGETGGTCTVSVVSALPEDPDENTLYLIPEEEEE